MPAAATQNQVVTYTPVVAAATPEERDLILIEQEKWGPFCGVLTRMGLARYLRGVFSADQEPNDEQAVNCCGAGGPLAIPIYVYELAPDVQYSLRSTVGTVGESGTLEPLVERESVSFALETTASIRHPASEIVQARWLAGPWTTGGAAVAPPPALTLDGRAVRSPVPIFGTVELTLRVRRWRHTLVIDADEANRLLVDGWAEFVMGLPSGGRPVGEAITPPPGAAEMAKHGYACGRGRGGDSGTINGPNDDDDPPVATGADKHIRCDYCELECEVEERGVRSEE